MANVNIILETLEPGSLDLSAPDNPEETRAVYRISGMNEAAIHSFIRMVPILGHAMAESNIPLDKIDKAARVVAVLADALEDGRVDAKELAAIIIAVAGS